MIELTNGLDELAVLPLPRRARLTLASFLLGFGGLAVQFQVRALAEAHDLPVRGLFAAKLLHGTLAAVLTAFLFSLSPAVLTVSSPELTPISVRFRYTLAVLFVSICINLGEKAQEMIYNILYTSCIDRHPLDRLILTTDFNRLSDPE